MSAQLSGRLTRLLNLVPYFISNPGISAADAAAELGVTPKVLMKDLNQLWMCGLPGYGPGDLIDLSFSEESIEVTFSAGIDRPLRLTSTEATALLVALRAVLEVPSLADPATTRSAIAKIEAAAGAAAAHGVTAIDIPAETQETTADPTSTTVRRALQQGHQLHIHYYSASRDALSERTVDPVRIVLIDDHSYLEAWCRQAEAIRLFRFDRIDAAVDLAVPVESHPMTSSSSGSIRLFDSTSLARESMLTAFLAIRKDSSWILDYYPMDYIATDNEGTVAATMMYASQDWMIRFILGLGGAVTVREPAELVEAVKKHALNGLAAYSRESERSAGEISCIQAEQ
ncbi:MAG: helix-turn-helix transcriptional regulator [Mycobacteriaceae bacterium]